MRQVVSYADLTPPSSKPSTADERTNSNGRPSSKNANYMPPSSSRPPQEGRDVTSWAEVKESRELTHEEIWDDSALIEAWNAATEEYEAMNGPEKGWKRDRVHKAPLWYNVPPKSLERKTEHGISATTSVPSLNVGDTADSSVAEGDSRPLDFDTYVPAYNPNLASSLEQPFGAMIDQLPSSLTEVTQDEAFSRALNAMYWTGYWTAIYHSRRQDVRCMAEEAPEDGMLEVDQGSETERA